MSGRKPLDEERSRLASTGIPSGPARAGKAAGRRRREVSPDLIQELRRQGLSFRQIARHTGFGYGTVRRAYWASEPDAIGAAD